MPESIIVALIGLGGSAMGAFVGIMINAKMMSYRLEQLENRFEKITSTQSAIDSRLYALEMHNEVQDERIKSLFERVDSLDKKGGG